MICEILQPQAKPVPARPASGSNLVLDRKKPAMLASIHGLYGSKHLILVEWYVFMTPLELFFKDNSHFSTSF
jgi:hypothetical protein